MCVLRLQARVFRQSRLKAEFASPQQDGAVLVDRDLAYNGRQQQASSVHTECVTL